MDSQVSATPRISARSLTLASAAQLLSNRNFGARSSVWEAVSDGQSLRIESSVAARRAPPTFKRGGYMTLLLKLTTQNPRHSLNIMLAQGVTVVPCQAPRGTSGTASEVR